MMETGYLIFKRSIANELLEKGFRIIKVEENFYDKKRCVFIFDRVEGLDECVAEIKKTIYINKSMS